MQGGWMSLLLSFRSSQKKETFFLFSLLNMRLERCKPTAVSIIYIHHRRLRWPGDVREKNISWISTISLSQNQCLQRRWNSTLRLFFLWQCLFWNQVQSLPTLLPRLAHSLSFVSSVRSSNSYPDLIVIQQQHPLFQITLVLNIGLSLSEPLQLYKGYNAI